MSDFDKFIWFEAIYAETEFSPGEKAVLGWIAIRTVKYSKIMFCQRQSTIATKCGISKVTVNAAIKRAKLLGYLFVSEEHQRGTGRNRADELTLTLPESSKGALPNSVAGVDESSNDALPNSGESGVKQNDELSKANDPCWVKHLYELSKAPDPSTSENNTPNSSLESSLTRDSSLGGGVDRSSPAYIRLGFAPSQTERTLGGITPPSRFCAEHQPSGIRGKCNPCGNARTHRKDEWPYTEDGIRYGQFQAGTERYVKRSGTEVAQQLEADRLRASVGGRVGRTTADVYADLVARQQAALPPSGAQSPRDGQ